MSTTAAATMKAFVTDGAGWLEAAKLPIPEAEGHDIVVKHAATSVNPIDGKQLGTPQGTVVGWDSVGTVTAVGPRAERFEVGDVVWFAGSIARPGTYAEYTAVDERAAALAPTRVPAIEAAALPLVGLTAIEGLTEKLGLSAPASIGKTLLVVNGAGGVGSIVTQFAKRVLHMRVIATASRPETVAFCKEQGADDVINHREPLLAQLEALGLKGVHHVFNAHSTTRAVVEQFGEVTLPNGGIVNIVGTEADETLPLAGLFFKRISFHWELMFQRLLSGDPADRAKQGTILSQLAFLVDAGVIKSHKQREYAFDLDGLKAAHDVQKSGKAIGKSTVAFERLPHGHVN